MKRMSSSASSSLAAPPRTTPLRLAYVGGVGAWFGPSIFAFEGIGPAISVFESLGSDPEPFARVVTAAFSFNVVLYGAVAALGYAARGDGVAQVLIDSFPDGGGSTSAELAMGALMHEMIHCLGFSRELFRFYRRADGAPHASTLVTSTKPYGEASPVALLGTPLVVRAVQAQFDCYTSDRGAELEGSGKDGGGQHASAK